VFWCFPTYMWNPDSRFAYQRLAGDLLSSIESYLARNPIGKVEATPWVIFSEVSVVTPDLAFVSHDGHDELTSGNQITLAPDLLVEIVSSAAGPSIAQSPRIEVEHNGR
jgi:Uma2 family endonuclease